VLHLLCALQVAVQAHQVVRELRQFSDVPLVYMAHPVAVVPSRDATQHADMNQRLKHVTERMRGSRCKGVLRSPVDVGAHEEDYSRATLVKHESVRRGFIKGTRLHLSTGVGTATAQRKGR
jgi:hypothetical protein